MKSLEVEERKQKQEEHIKNTDSSVRRVKLADQISDSKFAEVYSRAIDFLK